MPTVNELSERLDAINAKVENARQRIDFKRGLNDGHNLTSGELMARYEFLKHTLNDEVTEIGAHDHHVSALEQNALNWINSIDLGMA